MLGFRLFGPAKPFVYDDGGHRGGGTVKTG
jgi:hypothetical protein